MFQIKRVLSVILVGALSCLCGGCQSAAQPENTVATIDGLPVAYEELELFIDSAKQQTKAYFDQEYGVSLTDETAWIEPVNDIKPAAYALDLALRELAPYKVTQAMLVEQGALEDASYQSFLEQWETENKTRQQKKDMGQIIYGPVQYTQRVYYDYLDSEYRKTLEGLMTTDTPSDDELRTIYEDHPDLFQQFGTVTMRCITMPQEEVSQAAAEQRIQTLQQALSQNESFEQAAATAGLTAYMETQTITAKDFSAAATTRAPELFEAAENLHVGQNGGLLSGQVGSWLYYYCESREGNGRMSFEQCRETLTELYREQTFELSFNQAVENAEIEIKEPAYQIFG